MLRRRGQSCIAWSRCKPGRSIAPGAQVILDGSVGDGELLGEAGSGGFHFGVIGKVIGVVFSHHSAIGLFDGVEVGIKGDFQIGVIVANGLLRGSSGGMMVGGVGAIRIGRTANFFPRVEVIGAVLKNGTKAALFLEALDVVEEVVEVSANGTHQSVFELTHGDQLWEEFSEVRGRVLFVGKRVFAFVAKEKDQRTDDHSDAENPPEQGPKSGRNSGDGVHIMGIGVAEVAGGVIDKNAHAF